MKKHTKNLLFAITLNLLGSTGNLLNACDLHPIYTAINSNNLTDNRTDIGIMHQYTHYESNVKPVGQNDLPGQKLDSNIAQVFVDYRLNHKFSTQLNIPLISRDYRRLNDGHIENSSESGIGDISLLLKYRAFDLKQSHAFGRIEFVAGVKTPTGDSGRLKETREAQEGEEEEVIHEEEGFHQDIAFRHGGANGNLVGGEDLALGSGSFDWIGGTNLFYRQMNWFLLGGFQYTIRQAGDSGYHYGDDLQWHFGPGAYVAQGEKRDIALRLRFASDSKGKDRLDSERLNNTDQSRLFVGPELRYESKAGWSVILASNFAVKTESASDGIIPRYSMLSVFSIDL